MRTPPRQALLFALAIGLCPVPAPAGAAAPAEPPRLVVLVVVDQMPLRLYDRVLRVLPPGGLRRLAEGGRSLVGRYGHANTSTAPGHALLATGAGAGRSGIVGNEWWSRTDWRPAYCTEDPAYQVLGRASKEHEGTSPRNLHVEGVADALRAATSGRAKVLALSWKDRGAILPGGLHPSAAVWFDIVQGAFTTSTYYARELPAWLAHANAARPAARLVGTRWQPMAPARVLAELGGPDDAPGEGDYDGLGVAFPHPIRSIKAISMTPFANELLLEAALEGAAAYGLGRDAVPDFLVISFSASDFVGHVFGPDSREQLDLFFRLDRQVARLLGWLDQHVGAGRYAVVLTSDHGGASLPEHTLAAGSAGGPARPVRLPRDADIAALVEKAVARAVGPGWQAAMKHPHLYLRPPEKGPGAERLPAALAAARAALAQLPGVARVVDAADLARAAPEDAVAQAVLRSWDPDRSGDFYLVLGEGSVFEEELVPGFGTGHGSPHDYDQLVPLVFYGARVLPSRGERAQVPQESVASTLAALLGVPPPPAAERPALREALR